MSSGRVQLAAVGIQDDFLTGDPEVSYFTKKYARHTKFALEVIEATFDQQGFDFGSFITCKIPRNGQLIRGMYLKLVLPDLQPSSYGYTDSIGNAIIEHADLLIGGKVVERINGEYMQIYSQSFLGESQQNALTYLIGDTKKGLGGLGPASTSTTDTENYYGPYPRTMMVPLPFYFHRSDSLAIPLCALSRQEVEVQIKLRPLNQLIAYGTPTAGTLVLWQQYAITAKRFAYVTWMPFSLMFVLLNLTGTVYIYNANNTSLVPVLVSPLKAFTCSGICELDIPVVLAVSSAACASPVVYSSTNVFGYYRPVVGVSTDVGYNGIASDGAENALAITKRNEIALIIFTPGVPAPTDVFVIETLRTFVTVAWSAQNSLYILGTSEPSLYSFDPLTPAVEPALFSAGDGPYFLDYTPAGSYLSDSTPIAWDGADLFSNTTVTTNSATLETQVVPAFTTSIAWSPLFRQTMIVGDYGGFYIGVEPLLGGAVTVVKGSRPLQASLPVEYVFLGDDEIAMFQNTKMDYIITQIQQDQVYVPAGVTSVPIRLNGVNPARELFIVIQDESVVAANDLFNFKNTWTNMDQLQSLRLDFNGETILSDAIADELYLSILTFLNCHTRVPESYVYCLPFAIDPENDRPTGQVNLSRIQNKMMYLTLTENPGARRVRVFTKSFNILRIQCGLAGVMFMDNNSY